jgi:mono/diheme cytochrome c family protein
VQSFKVAGLLLLNFGLIACQSADSASPEKSDLVRRGQGVYQSQCAACHNSNPRVTGALGPAVAGSSLELLQARVLRGVYPEGYTPKGMPGGRRLQMPPMPYLEKDIPALHAYLNSFQ